MSDDAFPDWYVNVVASACGLDPMAVREIGPDGLRTVYGTQPTDAFERIDSIADTLEAIPDPTFASGAIATATERIAVREERELRGAWRAGYDRVDVYDADPEFGSGVGQVTLDRRYVPRHAGEDRRNPNGFRYAFSYDLDSVPDDVILDAIRGER